MVKPPFHPFETQRLASICGLHLLSTGHSPIFELAARQAAALCGTSMGFVTLIGESQQEILGGDGTGKSGTPREEAFCAYTILQPEPLVVEDALQDPRFAENPSVTSDPFVRFYAGVPFTDSSGLPLGSVCAVDTVPHTVSSQKLHILERLAAMVGVVMEARRSLVESCEGRPEALGNAIRRLETALEPLFDRQNGFRGFVA